MDIKDQPNSSGKIYPESQAKGVIRIGKQNELAQGDIYHFLLRITWSQFVVLIAFFICW